MLFKCSDTGGGGAKVDVIILHLVQMKTEAQLCLQSWNSVYTTIAAVMLEPLTWWIRASEWPILQEGSTQAVPSPQELWLSPRPGESMSYHYFHLPTQVTLLRSSTYFQGTSRASWVLGSFLPCQGTFFSGALCLGNSGLLSSLIFSPSSKSKQLGSLHFSVALRSLI